MHISCVRIVHRNMPKNRSSIKDECYCTVSSSYSLRGHDVSSRAIIDGTPLLSSQLDYFDITAGSFIIIRHILALITCQHYRILHPCFHNYAAIESLPELQCVNFNVWRAAYQYRLYNMSLDISCICLSSFR